MTKLKLKKMIVLITICFTGSATMFAQEIAVEINGVIWATRNVNIPHTFVDNPEDAGLFYKCDIEHNVCPAGWRMPTHKEFQLLTHATSTWTTENGVNGRRFTDIETNASIFLPAAGIFNYTDGSVKYVGSSGLYWSSTVNGIGSAVYNLNFGSGSFTPDNSQNRANGLSVRCVKDY